MPQITLAAARKNAGFTQVEVANKLGITPKTLVEWEKDPGRIKVKNLNRLCELYKIPLSYIFLQK